MQPRKYNEHHIRAIKKHGGLITPMNLIDSETGKTVYDNRDATIMAIKSVKDFKARTNYTQDEKEAYIWNVLMEDHKCDKCQSSTHVYLITKYFSEENRCPRCWCHPSPEKLPKDLEKIQGILEKIEAMFDLPEWNDEKGKKEREEWEKKKANLLGVKDAN